MADQKSNTTELATTAAAIDLGAVVDAWFNERIATGFIARQTDAYNQVVTALPDLKAVRPEVYAKLKDGRAWTREAEEELLRLRRHRNIVEFYSSWLTRAGHGFVFRRDEVLSVHGTNGALPISSGFRP